MDPISVFVVAFGGGFLTGMVLCLWSRRSGRDHPASRD